MITTRDFSVEAQRHLVDLLLDCLSMSNSRHRAAVLKQLPRRIQDIVFSGDNAKTDVSLLIDACLNYQWGMEALLDAIYYFESNSIGIQAIYDFLQRVRPQSVSLLQLAELRTILQGLEVDDTVLLKSYRSASPTAPLPTAYAERGLLPCLLDTLATSLDERRPIIPFVRSLIGYSADPNTRMQIEQWTARIALELGYREPITPVTSILAEQSNEPTEPFSLLVALQMLPELPGSYSVRAWVWGSGMRRLVFETERWEIPGHLPQLLHKLLNEVSDEVEAAGSDPMLEFFLPMELIGDAIEQQTLSRKVVIGYKYCVVVRLYERAFDEEFQYLRARWKNRWNALHADPNHLSRVIDSLDDERELEDVLEHHYCFGLACALQHRSEHYALLHEIMLEAGTVIALWPRQRVEAAEPLPLAIRELVQLGKLADLQRTVWDHRKDAWNQAADLPGRHLTLLWDDPHRLPTRLRLQAPTVSGDQ